LTFFGARQGYSWSWTQGRTPDEIGLRRQCPTGGALRILLLSENDWDDRGITSRLYGGDTTLRSKQEIVLRIGGEILLRALGFEIASYHFNEGHAAEDTGTEGMVI
jgi:glucan phosphorylase